MMVQQIELTTEKASEKEIPLEDEDDDDDYNPEEDVDIDDDDDDDDDAIEQSKSSSDGIPSSTLSEAKRKAVDEAFLQMFGYNFGTRFLPKRRKVNGPSDATQDLLIRIFGPTAAAQIMATTSDTIAATKVKRATLPTTTSRTITEVKRYAGTTIEVKRKVNARDSLDSGHADGSKPRGLDSLLQELEGPGKLSTVAKTSADWESFKQEAGVEAEIEKQAQGKNAFLVKQDFLQRVDQRSFVQEKAKRDQERSKRGK
ncbi:Bucentaur or craniofacial development [Fragilaria crotonensis]|nr:Bucentaur or craniofacial development [Fragilaria crotonensis]